MKCYVCNKAIKEAKEYVICIKCKTRFHTKCVDLKQSCPICCEEDCLEIVKE